MLTDRMSMSENRRSKNVAVWLFWGYAPDLNMPRFHTGNRLHQLHL